MLNTILNIIEIIHKFTFALSLSMFLAGIVLTAFFTFKAKEEQIYITIMKYSFVISVISLILKWSFKSIV